MDNEQKKWNKDNPFKVNIEDDGFLNPDELEKILPVEPQKKKFEVHIDEDVREFDSGEQQPEYKGEIYFSNRRPVRPAPQQPVNADNNRADRKPSQGNAKKGGGKKNASRSVLAIFLTVVIVFTSALSAVAISCINDVLAIGRDDEVVKITIPSDATTESVIDILADEGLIKQKLFCNIYYKLIDFVKNFNRSGEPVEPVYLSGIYYVEKNLGLEGYLMEFREIQKTADTITLVFPEGWSIYQMFDKIAEFGVCSKEQLIASLKEATFDYDFISEIPDDADRTFKLEGYLYPDTYEFYEESDANSIIRKFLDASEKKWTDEYEEQRIALGLTRDEVIIIASIIQREAANTEQMSQVSSVIHNRLNNSVSWPLLGCDSTDTYITSYVRPNVSPSEAIAYEQSYNTYFSQGLPPGPICNPGDAAIRAALFPSDTDYFYFRHDKYGKIYMAKTQAEHDRNGSEVLRVNSR